MIQIFTLTTRGLEPVSAKELAGLPGINVTQIAYRRVAADYSGPIAALAGLRTVDDVFLDIAAWSAIGRPRSTLDRLRQLSTRLELRDAIVVCSELRPIPTPPTFTIVASFVGRRNYNADEIKQAVREGIEASHDWSYSARDREADLSIRLFIEHDIAFVGLRLTKTPLHERPYKQANTPGSIKPSVAAALVLMSGVNPGMRLLDPFCGAGTILVEAASLGVIVRGGDIEASAVAALLRAAATAGILVDIQEWDARSLPIGDAVVDCIVSNLPWGRQITVDTSLANLYREALKEMSRVLVPNSPAILLTSTPQLLDTPYLQVDKRMEISLFGQTPTVSILRRVS